MTAPFEIKDIGWRRAAITPSVACGDTSLEEGGGKQKPDLNLRRAMWEGQEPQVPAGV